MWGAFWELSNHRCLIFSLKRAISQKLEPSKNYLRTKICPVTIPLHLALWINSQIFIFTTCLFSQDYNVNIITYIAYLKCSSNLMVAALWKTTFTLSQSNFRSSGFIPSSGKVISPNTGTNFSWKFGCSLRSLSYTWNK